MKEVFLNVTGTEKIRETRKAKEGDPAIFTCAFRIQSKKKKKTKKGHRSPKPTTQAASEAREPKRPAARRTLGM